MISKYHYMFLVELESSKTRYGLAKWEKLCCPKEEGGIRFKMICGFNLDLLAKQL